MDAVNDQLGSKNNGMEIKLQAPKCILMLLNTELPKKWEK